MRVDAETWGLGSSSARLLLLIAPLPGCPRTLRRPRDAFELPSGLKDPAFGVDLYAGFALSDDAQRAVIKSQFNPQFNRIFGDHQEAQKEGKYKATFDILIRPKSPLHHPSCTPVSHETSRWASPHRSLASACLYRRSSTRYRP
jgi:hypothetical protein